jgi:hypothetical protein
MGQPWIALMCGIVWETCTLEVWDPDQPYGIIVEGCRTRFSECPYIMYLGFSPAGCISVAIVVPHSNEYPQQEFQELPSVRAWRK